MTKVYDIAIIGAGISGLSSALRLQNLGYKTLLVEAHGQVGGCAGFYERKNFSFDVGATTLVDFESKGVGDEFLKSLNLDIPKHEVLDYKFWLPDRVVTLYNNRQKWYLERLEKFGNSTNHITFWKLIDKITDAFWAGTRLGLKLPIQTIKDVGQNIKSLGLKNLFLLKYLNTPIIDVLKKFNLDNDKPLVYFLSALIEDTIHSNIQEAPFINAALGTSIRGAGVMRLNGGMKSLWKLLENKYLSIGGVLKKRNKVSTIDFNKKEWTLTTNKSEYKSKIVVSSLPINNTLNLVPSFVKKKINDFYNPKKISEGGAIVLFLGTPENEVKDEDITHHQIIESYSKPLGLGNNMFISISEKNDTLSAPEGFRSVMISTHCDLESWKNLSEEDYLKKKEESTEILLTNARKIYPSLGKNSIISELGTPKSYEKYTHRLNGAVGGFKQTVINANLKSIPQNIGLKNFYLVGDNTWPGLGTVAGIVASDNLTKEITKNQQGVKMY